MLNCSFFSTLSLLFSSRQVWLWPMWTPACLPIRPPLLLSVSESTCWTWFPPAPSPKQPTHGNNAIFLPTDIITIPPLNINNSHSHDHSNPFYGLCFWPNGAGKNQFLILDRGVPSALSQIFLQPSSLPEPFTPNGVSMQQRGLLTHKEYVELNLGTFFEGWGLHGRVPFFKLLQRCCLSLLVCWLILSVAPRGITPELPCLWIRLGQI